ncbi:MAG: lysophospholipid acyltransferase family protein [Tannerella sp.]|jgi:putative hemolysin|nr:lysophospholipid acyltransferase family protein [Tannerella sp.]
MKETVIDLQDLQECIPLFRSRLGAFLAKKIIKWLAIEKVNRIHSNHCHLRGAAFTSAMLSDPLMNVKYKIHNEERLNTLPEGAFITVSNHPIGSLDGIILIDIFASRRPDFKVMVNGVLTKIGAMTDNFISVTPKTDDKNSPNRANVNGIRLSMERLKDGHPMGFFPAGAMSFIDRKKQICDLPWAHTVIRLIKKAKVPVYPVCFDCRNSDFFYLLGKINWKIRVLRVAYEAFNKCGKTLDVYIGEPIPAQTVQHITDDRELADFLYSKTYGAKSQVRTG